MKRIVQDNIRLRTAALTLLCLIWPTLTTATTFTVSPGSENQVVFASHATLESFEGKTHQITGTITFDPDVLEDSLAAVLEVDLASLDTGISLRNKHMRENHLETATYPKAVFRSSRILRTSARALSAGQSIQLRVAGLFELHGVSRAIEVPVEAQYLNDGTLHVATHFDVTLADYKIPRPSFLMLKLEDTQHVTVRFVAHPHP
jgi:polyisoprenoid-binding protein YceI